MLAVVMVGTVREGHDAHFVCQFYLVKDAESSPARTSWGSDTARE